MMKMTPMTQQHDWKSSELRQPNILWYSRRRNPFSAIALSSSSDEDDGKDETDMFGDKSVTGSRMRTCWPQLPKKLGLLMS